MHYASQMHALLRTRACIRVFRVCSRIYLRTAVSNSPPPPPRSQALARSALPPPCPALRRTPAAPRFKWRVCLRVQLQRSPAAATATVRAGIALKSGGTRPPPSSRTRRTCTFQVGDECIVCVTILRTYMHTCQVGRRCSSSNAARSSEIMLMRTKSPLQHCSSKIP